MDFIVGALCQSCGEPSSIPLDPPWTCHTCQQNGPLVQCHRSAVHYTNPSRHLVFQLKHNQQKHMVPFLVTLMGPLVLQFPTATALIPVPLHWKKLSRRCFNQSALLAKGLSHYSGLPYVNLLKRKRHTVPQGKKTIQERSLNVQQAFVAGSMEKFHGTDVILVDDVYASGATLNACAEALYLSGIRTVFAVTFAKSTYLTLSQRTYLGNGLRTFKN